MLQKQCCSFLECHIWRHMISIYALGDINFDHCSMNCLVSYYIITNFPIETIQQSLGRHFETMKTLYSLSNLIHIPCLPIQPLIILAWSSIYYHGGKIIISQLHYSFHVHQLSFYSKEEPFPLPYLFISIVDPWIPILLELISVLITKMPQIAQGETL